MKDATSPKRRRITISRSFLGWLLLIVILGFLVSMQFIWIHQTNMSTNSALSLLTINVQDVRQDVIDASDENLLKLTRRIGEEIDGGASMDTAELERMLEVYDVAEINVIDGNGMRSIPKRISWDNGGVWYSTVLTSLRARYIITLLKIHVQNGYLYL